MAPSCKLNKSTECSLKLDKCDLANNIHLFHLQLSLSCPLPCSRWVQLFELYVRRSPSPHTLHCCQPQCLWSCSRTNDQKRKITHNTYSPNKGPFPSRERTYWRSVNAALTGSTSSTASLNAFSPKGGQGVHVAKRCCKASFQLCLNNRSCLNCLFLHLQQRIFIKGNILDCLLGKSAEVITF